MQTADPLTVTQNVHKRMLAPRSAQLRLSLQLLDVVIFFCLFVFVAQSSCCALASPDIELNKKVKNNFQDVIDFGGFSKSFFYGEELKGPVCKIIWKPRI